MYINKILKPIINLIVYINISNKYRRIAMKLEQEKEIGKQLVAYREKARLTQQEVGDLTGLSSDQIGLLERGQRNWTLSTLIKVTNALNINLTTLLQPFEQDDELTNQFLQRIERNPMKETLLKAFNEILDTYDD